jgi:starch-binding outer membrane protein, SusD/RagB family
MNLIIKIRSILIIASILFLCSCKKYLQVDPPREQLLRQYAFTDQSTADAVATGMYTRLTQQISTASRGASMYADELIDQYNSITSLAVQNNALKADENIYVKPVWINFYQAIFSANTILEQIDKAPLRDSVKHQLKGEAFFTRAYVHFLLSNFWGDVPYITTTDVNVSEKLARDPVEDVYKNIINDIKSAQSLLQTSYPTSGRVRPNVAVASALLAEVYLYKGDWANAEAEASRLINNSTYLLEPDPINVFLRPSRETIWALNTANGFTNDGATYIPSSGVPIYLLRSGLLNSFDSADKRKTAWIRTATVSGVTYYSPYKYKQRTTVTNSALTEDLVIFRLGEQYLIRAEARLNQNNPAGAIADINVIRSRAGLPSLNSNLSSSQVALAIEQEKRLELMFENFHRWFDLKRTGRASVVLGALKSTWVPTAILYPIPVSEILVDPNLAQNPGY